MSLFEQYDYRSQKKKDLHDFKKVPVPMPDIQYLVENIFVPQKIRDEFWSAINKDIVLANLDENDLWRIRNELDVIRMLHFMRKPFRKHSLDEVLLQKQIALYSYIISTRGRYGFERKMLITRMLLQSQTQPTLQQLSPQQLLQQREEERKKGLLARVFGR